MKKITRKQFLKAKASAEARALKGDESWQNDDWTVIEGIAQQAREAATEAHTEHKRHLSRDRQPDDGCMPCHSLIHKEG